MGRLPRPFPISLERPCANGRFFSGRPMCVERRNEGYRPGGAGRSTPHQRKSRSGGPPKGGARQVSADQGGAAAPASYYSRTRQEIRVLSTYFYSRRPLSGARQIIKYSRDDRNVRDRLGGSSSIGKRGNWRPLGIWGQQGENRRFLGRWTAGDPHRFWDPRRSRRFQGDASEMQQEAHQYLWGSRKKVRAIGNPSRNRLRQKGGALPAGSWYPQEFCAKQRHVFRGSRARALRRRASWKHK